MYRAIVLTTLVLLLSAIAGVSVAQEGTIFAGDPNGEAPSETTTPEPTSLEATGPDDETTRQPPDPPSETEDRRDPPEQTVVTEPTVVDETTAGGPEKPTAASAHGRTPTPGANGAGMPGDSGRKVGKPEHAREAPGLSNPRTHVVPRDVGKPAERAHGKPDPGAGQPKVVLCHKGKTLTVGAPAQAAHLRHGDSPGACR